MLLLLPTLISEVKCTRKRTGEKMTAAVLRKELKGYIEAMPPYMVEMDLTDEEIAMIDAGMAEYWADPASFVPLESIS
jgi:hypothetical protein